MGPGAFGHSAMASGTRSVVRRESLRSIGKLKERALEAGPVVQC